MALISKNSNYLKKWYQGKFVFSGFGDLWYLLRKNFKDRYRFFSVIFLLAFVLLIPKTGETQVFMGKKKALKTAFPDADRVERKNIFFTDEQRKVLQQTARASFGERLYTYYIGFQGDTLLRYAFIDTHVVKSKTETVMVVVSTEGEIEFIRILAFYEPPEYMPSSSWLGQIIGKTLDDPIQIHQDVDTISGATVSTDSIASLARKVLAFHKIILEKKE